MQLERARERDNEREAEFNLNGPIEDASGIGQS